jgi:hypothetical protein
MAMLCKLVLQSECFELRVLVCSLPDVQQEIEQQLELTLRNLVALVGGGK